MKSDTAAAPSGGIETNVNVGVPLQVFTYTEAVYDLSGKHGELGQRSRSQQAVVKASTLTNYIFCFISQCSFLVASSSADARCCV